MLTDLAVCPKSEGVGRPASEVMWFVRPNVQMGVLRSPSETAFSPSRMIGSLEVGSGGWAAMASPWRLPPVGCRTTRKGFDLCLGTLYSGYTDDPCGHLRVLGCQDSSSFHRRCGMGKGAPWSKAIGNAFYCRCPYNRLARRRVLRYRTQAAPLCW